MAKRNNRKTDSQETPSPERRRRATPGQSGADEAARAPRPRRKTDAASTAAEGSTAPIAAAVSTPVASAVPETAPPVSPAPQASTTASPNAAPATATGTHASGVRIVEVPPPSVDVPHEHIAVRAYHIYLERGGRGGDDFEDWITAERELRERATGSRRR